MKFGNAIQDVAQCICSACIRDLPDIVYQYRKPGQSPEMNVPKRRRPETYDVTGVLLWQQMWGSTAMGFGGIGGSAMTEANVVVVFGPSRAAAVYFGGRLAYVIERPNAKFNEDVRNHNLGNVAGASKRYEMTEGGAK